MRQESALVVVERPRVSTIGKSDLTAKQLGRAERRPGHQRRYAPKTRSGCITCKIRRVKCDEGKPQCKRCTSTGRKCDGYSSATDSRRGRTSEPLTVALVNDTGSVLERRASSFFRSRTAPSISSYFQDPVWNRILLQLSQTEPAVRFAANALGALHEEKILRNSASKDGVDVSLVKTGFPLAQYAKALNELKTLLKDKSSPLDVVLSCFLLCIQFESLRESFVPALMYCENAIQLLLSEEEVKHPRKVDTHLVYAIMRSDLQGTMYLGAKVPGLVFYSPGTLTLPNSLQDLSDARDLVDTWTCRLYYFMRTVADNYKFREPGGVTLEDLAKAQELEQTFIALDQLLLDFMHRPSIKLNIKEQHGVGMLRSRVKMNKIQAATCLYSETCVYDMHTTDFEDIVTICRFMIGSDSGDRRLFSVGLDEGLIQPLFFVALNCRESRVRHPALILFRRFTARDGTWHVQTSLRAAELVIRFEEESCESDRPSCKDIPEWRRVHCPGFKGWNYDARKQMIKVDLRTRPNGTDGEWLDFREDYEWSVPNRRFEESFRMLMFGDLQTVTELFEVRADSLPTEECNLDSPPDTSSHLKGTASCFTNL